MSVGHALRKLGSDLSPGFCATRGITVLQMVPCCDKNSLHACGFHSAMRFCVRAHAHWQTMDGLLRDHDSVFLVLLEEGVFSYKCLWISYSSACPCSTTHSLHARLRNRTAVALQAWCSGLAGRALWTASLSLSWLKGVFRTAFKCSFGSP